MANRQISSVLNTAKSFMLYFTDGLNRKEKKSIHIAVRVTVIVIQIIKFPREYTPFASRVVSHDPFKINSSNATIMSL